jgi:hypothetical protein
MKFNARQNYIYVQKFRNFSTNIVNCGDSAGNLRLPENINQNTPREHTSPILLLYWRTGHAGKIRVTYQLT